jgi:hypothetical protein
MGVKSPLNVGFLTAMPYAAGATGMVLVGKSADYHRERRFHVAIPPDSAQLSWSSASRSAATRFRR